MKPNYVLLCAKRARDASTKFSTPVEEALSDRARILYSSPFRRLQDKAQVFSLESNAAIRSRLTHSLEVSMVGRLLAQKLISRTEFDDAFKDQEEKEAFAVYAETACLMHDLGNPPFGHFCEKTIQEWFSTRKSKFIDSLGIKKKQAAQKLFDIAFIDFEKFDGNPQGFRIVTKLQSNHDEFGLNLTATQLAASLKYPWSSIENGRPKKKKIGVFYTEHPQLEKVRKSSGLRNYQRHFLAYVMEAADDISYCLSDIEDGIEKRIVDWEKFINYLKERIPGTSNKLSTPDLKLIARLQNLPSRFDAPELDATTPKSWQSAMLHLRTSISRRLIDHCIERCIAQKAALLNGNVLILDSLIDDDPCGPGWTIQAVKSFSKQHLYPSRAVRLRELTAHRVIGGLLDSFECLLKDCSRERFELLLDGGSHVDANGKSISVEAALVSLLPKKYIHAYQNELKHVDATTASKPKKNVIEFIVRSHLIVDYITGMSDEFALATYQLVYGVRTNE